MAALLPILDQVAKSGQSLLVIASDVEAEALSIMIVNNRAGTLRCAAIKPPGLGDRKIEMLRDIACATGGTAYLQSDGVPLHLVGNLGHADKVIVGKENTTIVGGQGDNEALGRRIEQIRSAIQSRTSVYDQMRLKERLARLTSGVAVLRVGGSTNSEKVEKVYAATSGLHACSAAKERGTVAGGGRSLFAARMFARKIVVSGPNEAEGAQAVLNALAEPLKCIVRNAGKNEEEVIAAILKSPDDVTSLNVSSGAIEDLRSAGVIEPARSLHSALRLAYQHARSHLSAAAFTEDTLTGRLESGEELEVKFRKSDDR